MNAKHYDEGSLRAWLDGALPGGQAEGVEAHLAACQNCRALADELRARQTWAASRLSALSPAASSDRAARQARAAYDVYLQQKERTTMTKSIFSRTNRLAWAGIALVALLAISLAFPPVQAMANSFLGLFRVQRVQVVSVNPGNLPERLGSSAQLQALFTNNVTIEESGQAETAETPEQASELAGFPVRTLAGMASAPALHVSGAGKMSFLVDLALVEGVLAEIGRDDIRLPAELDGATVSVDTKPGVTVMYGACALEEPNGAVPQSAPLHSTRLSDCVTLMQMPSPAVEAPAGLDIAQIGQAYLQIMGMTSEEAARFSQNIDWATTLVVPLPVYAADYQEVTVDGVPGTLITQASEERAPQYLLLWVKDGVVYALTGAGTAQDAMRLAGGLR